MGRVKYKVNDKIDASLALAIGPELDHDNSHYRTVLDGTVSCACTDNLTLLADAVFGYQAEPSGTGDDLWYGISGYAVYKVSDMLNINARGEFYRDEEGFTTGIAQSLFEATLGVTVTPFPNDTIGSNLKVRPEVRYDYSTRGYFNGFTEHSQFTVGVDAYFDF
jgi:Putative beta-barrel porin-2, OmpL-like. bbp2